MLLDIDGADSLAEEQALDPVDMGGSLADQPVAFPMGDVARQVDAILEIAEATMGQAGGRLEDVVRLRIYLTDIALADQAGRALATYFRDIRPAATLVQVSRLARPAQLIEIELDAVDGAKEKAERVSSGRPTEEIYAYSRAVRVGERLFVAGVTRPRRSYDPVRLPPGPPC